MKIIFRILLGLIVLIAALLLICVRPIERTPYQQTEYYRKTLSGLASTLKAMPVQTVKKWSQWSGLTNRFCRN